MIGASSEQMTCPQFDYWATVLQLELTVLVYVRSLSQGSFQMYMDTLTELATWLDGPHQLRALDSCSSAKLVTVW